MPVSDIFTGVYSVIGILAALAQRERTGKGCYVDTALVDSTVGVLANQGMNYLASGKVPERIGNAHPNIVPYQVFPVADGYIIIATGNDSQYVKLCGVLGAPELAKDPAYIDNKARRGGRTWPRAGPSGGRSAGLRPQPRRGTGPGAGHLCHHQASLAASTGPRVASALFAGDPVWRHRAAGAVGQGSGGLCRDGGGVWLIPDGNLSPLRFNEAFAPLLNGFAVGALKTADPVQTVARDEAGVAASVFLPLLREEWGNLPPKSTSASIMPPKAGRARWSVRAANGDPLAVMVPHSRGRLFVQLFSGGLEGGSLPRSTAFVPLVQELAATLGRGNGADGPDLLRVGEVAHLDVPEFRSLKGDVVISAPQDEGIPAHGFRGRGSPGRGPSASGCLRGHAPGQAHQPTPGWRSTR